MIAPLQAHETLLEDIAAARNETNHFHVWWLGQSGFLVQCRGKHLLLDPYLSDSLTKKYATTDKPHVRMTELCVDPTKLDFVDVVTSSHNHTDHLDGETLTALMSANPEVAVVVPAANRDFAADRLHVDSGRLTEIDDGQSVDIAGFRLHAVPAAHETVERDAEGRCKFIGLVAEFEGHAIYHSGDTMLYDGMVNRLKKWEIDLALLPINGRSPERRVAGNLFGAEAAGLAAEIGAKMVIPCHYDMFEFNTETPDEFVATCQQKKQPHHVLRCGERFSLSLE